MSLFNKIFGNKKKELTTEEEVLPFLKEIGRVDKPMGIVVDGNTYSVAPYPDMVMVAVNNKEFIEVYKYLFMDIEDIISEAEAFHKGGKPDEAKACIDQALKLQNQLSETNRDWRVYYLAGNIYMRKRIFESAVGLFNWSVEYDCPYKIKVLNSMGACLSIMGEKKNAEEAYLLALAIDKNHTETLHNIGGFYWDCDMLGTAGKYYVRALETDINYIASYEELGNLLNTMGNMELSNYFLTIFNKKTIDNNTPNKLIEARAIFDNV